MTTATSRIAKSIMDRLLEKHIINENGCWLFTGALDELGYGQLLVQGGSKRAHRVSWQEFNGPIPENMHVLHKCDVRNCINPDHLFLGTHTDNMQDMLAKGRGASRKGVNNGNAALSNEDVVEVLRLIKESKLTQTEIGSRFGIAQSTVSYIKRQGWQNLKDEVNNGNR